MSAMQGISAAPEFVPDRAQRLFPRLGERVSLPGGWVRRATAAIWMNMLIGAVVLVAALTGGLLPDGQTLADDGLAFRALTLFAVWLLSFLPGWLYVRFLGLRAGALWNEYVLYLHRLGWDRPAHLPEPPRNSD